MSACPTAATLCLLGSGELGQATFQRIEEHVESCDRCQRFLQALVRDDRREHEPTPGPLPGRGAFPSVPGFIIERELGRGSNGVVYLAEEPRLGRQVALKILPGGVPGEARSPDPWLAEARAVSRLRHPNVVRLYQVIETDEWRVLVLEYLPGGTLRDRLSAPLAPRDSAAILERLAVAIGHIHQSGLLHLDMKPSNILVDDDFSGPLDPSALRISDFGIARPFVESATAVDGRASPRGTPSYMAPEQTGEGDTPIGPAADVYALGALFYHLLTGRPPFQSPTAGETFELVRTVEPVPPHSLNPLIPRDLETVCLRCLRKEPERRYPSAGALADDLRRWLDGRPITVRPVSSIEYVARWRRRRPAIAGLAIALVITTLAALGGLLRMLERAESARAQAVASRKAAEANERVASRALEELQVWIEPVFNEPKLFQEDRLRTFVEDTERLAGNLRADKRIASRTIASACMLRRCHAHKLATQPSRLAEASALLAKSRQLLTDCLRERPNDDVLRAELVLTLLESGDVAASQWFGEEEAAARQRLLEQAEQDYADVVAVAPAVSQGRQRIGLLMHISTRRRSLAYRFMASGSKDAVNRPLTANLGMFASLSPTYLRIPDLRLEKALNLAALGRPDEAIPSLRELIQLGEDAWLQPEDRGKGFDEWIAVQLTGALLTDRSGATSEDSTGLENRARAVIESIRRRAHVLGLRESEVPAVALALAKHTQIACAIKRKERKIRESRSMERRFFIFAEQVVEAYPDQPVSHLVLSEAHIQVAKNAWHREAGGEAAEAIRNSLAAARRAASLDPNFEEARHFVDDREHRLARALSN